MYIIRNCFLIDGLADEGVDHAMVAVDEGRVCYAGRETAEALEIYRGWEMEDAGGRTVMPGMIDAHVHLCMNGEPDNFRNMIMENAGLAVIHGVKRAQEDLKAGFTTIRCCGEKGEIDMDIRQAVQEGTIAGPRILASGKALTITGGHGDMFSHSAMEADWIAEVCDGEDEVRKCARKRIKRRADNIKLMATGGGMSPGPATVAQLNIAEMTAAVQEAVKNGICTAAHCIGEEGCFNAVEAGVRTIEHGTFLNEETIRRMSEKGTFLMSTLCAFRTIKYGATAGVPEEHLKKVEMFAQHHYVNLHKALEAGVKVGVGTDTGTPFNYHGENAYELECLTDNGMTPMEAIKAATSVNAEALLQEDIGSLEPGKTADMLLVDGNPLLDITILQDKERIRKVYRDGSAVVDRDKGIMPAF